MRLVFTHEGWDDYLYWQRTDRATLTRLNRLIKDVLRDPFDGIGNPEPLRNQLAGFWSRRIDDEHRLVCQADNEEVVIVQARHHYK